MIRFQETRFGAWLHRRKMALLVRPCWDPVCRSANPYHDSHLTALGHWWYVGRTL